MATAATVDAAAQPAAGGRKLRLALAAALVTLLAAGGAAAWLMGLLGPATGPAGDTAPGQAAPEVAAAKGADGNAAAPKVVFIDLPDVLVNLASDQRRPRYLKLKVTLEVANEAVAREVGTLAPRVMDSFQGYLRALRLEDVEGARGMQTLKEELLARVNLAISPTRVEDVLFKEMLLQ
jgi:flagellar FliL protein